jgi:hypothetical protein
MPFKGDMRLGGPHDNEANLNGTSSDFEGVGGAGSVIGTLSNTAYILGPVVGYNYYSGQNQLYAETYTQRCTVNIVSDGIGGQYYDYTTATNIEYYPFGTMLHENHYSYPSYLYFNGSNYENGSYYESIVHDGNGGVTGISGPTSYTSGFSEFYQESLGYTAYFPDTDSNYTVGTYVRHYYHDNNGGYSTWDEAESPYPSGTVVGQQTGTGEIEIMGNYYPSYSYYNNIEWNGTSLQWGWGETSYYPNNSLIVIDDSNNNHYYHNGSGGYFVNEGGPLATGNYNSGTNYIEINGNQYANGTYSETEYYWYNGGTTWITTYAYEAYGYTFYTDSYYDESTMLNVYTHYKSDEAGGYFTETSST